MSRNVEEWQEVVGCYLPRIPRIPHPRSVLRALVQEQARQEQLAATLRCMGFDEDNSCNFFSCVCKSSKIAKFF